MVLGTHGVHIHGILSHGQSFLCCLQIADSPVGFESVTKHHLPSGNLPLRWLRCVVGCVSRCRCFRWRTTHPGSVSDAKAPWPSWPPNWEAAEPTAVAVLPGRINWRRVATSTGMAYCQQSLKPVVLIGVHRYWLFYDLLVLKPGFQWWLCNYSYCRLTANCRITGCLLFIEGHKQL